VQPFTEAGVEVLAHQLGLLGGGGEIAGVIEAVGPAGGEPLFSLGFEQRRELGIAFDVDRGGRTGDDFRRLDRDGRALVRVGSCNERIVPANRFSAAWEA